MTIGQHFTGGTAPAPRSGRPQVAVVGAGVAGLTSAYLLQRRYDVTLYEAQDRLGGHAHTHDIVSGDGRVLALDSGFLVHNTRTYPNLIRLFAELGVATRDTEMSMSVRCEGCGLEYAGSRGPLELFPAVGSVARPEYLAALATVPGFYRDARRLLRSPGAEPLSLDEFLRQGGYRRYFVSHFVIPLVAAVWSCPPADALGYPARYLFEFVDHHGMPLPHARALPPAPGVHPAVPAVPRGAVGLARAAVARAFLSRAAARLPIRVQAPDGRLSGAGGPRSPVLMIRDQDTFYRRLGSGTAGLAEAYMTGAWDCDDLTRPVHRARQQHHHARPGTIAGAAPLVHPAPADRRGRHHRRSTPQHPAALRPVR